MKILLAFTLLISIYVVSSEYCNHDSDCKLTVCGANFTLDCYGRGDNVCTCIPNNSNSYSCTGDGSSSCKAAHGDCNHGDHRWHCYDGRCRCSIFG